MMENILVIGATSAIVEKVLNCLATKPRRFYLVGRNIEKLKSIAQNLESTQGCKSQISALDFADNEAIDQCCKNYIASINQIDICIIGHGYLGDQQLAQRNAHEMHTILTINFISFAHFLNTVVNKLEKQKTGQLVVFSSVAGDRGRKTNYIYGAAKAGLNTLVQGIQHRLAQTKIQVLLVKPGIVNTPMTAHLKKTALFAEPEEVAQGVLKALQSGKSSVYLPSIWRAIMLIITHLPMAIFKRLNI